jgi:hypothetical protein
LPAIGFPLTLPGADGVTLVLSAFVDPLDPTCTGNGALVFPQHLGRPDDGREP